MATKTFEELKQLAIQIRDEKTNKQNTATRVGTEMLEHINKLEQDYYDKTQTDEELKERDDKLTELNNNLGIVIGGNKSINSEYDLSYNNTVDTKTDGLSYSEKTGVVYNLTLTSNININTEFPSNGTFYVFGKFRLVTKNENRKAVMLNSIATNNASIELNNTEFATNKIVKLYLGKVTFTSRPGYFYLNQIQVKDLQGGNVGESETIKLEYYGGYLVEESVLVNSDMQDVADKLDYSSYPCLITLKGWKDSVDEEIESIKSSVNENKNLSDELSGLRTTINSSFTSVISAYDVRKDAFLVDSSAEDNGDYLRIVIPQPTYVKSFQTKSYLKMDAGKYSVFAKLKISTDKSYDTTDLFANVYLRRQGKGSSNSGLYNIPLNKIVSVYLGDFEDDGTNSYYYISLEYIRKGDASGTQQTQLGTINFDFYGSYYVKESEVSDTKEFIADFIDFKELETKVILKSVFSKKSEIADKSTQADFASTSNLANNINNIFRTSSIKIYGDSLVVYISWNNLKRLFDVESVMQGIGGVKVCNNSTDVNYGLCTLERIAAFPRNMKLLVIYGGANDNAETTEIPYSLDERLLGSISDEPLKIADMLNYRVTTDNISNTNTLGRAQTFYQGYKTMLRNIMALFPNCQIICVTQHRYYYYLKPEGGFSETPILRRDAYAKVKAIREIAEEYSVPVCDLWATSGVNDRNRRYTLIDMAGVLVHQTEATAAREESLIINKILETAPKFEIPNYTTTNGEDIIEMKKWVIDVRDEVECNVMTLDEAIAAFVQKTTSEAIELKNNMLLPFYYNTAFASKVYILKDYTQPSLTESWEEWIGGKIDDPNEPD